MSSQKIKPPKICKCGHDNKSHMKNPNSKLHLTSYCRSCACSVYLNRKHPTKSDRIGVILLPIFFIGFVITILSAYFLAISDPAIDQHTLIFSFADFNSLLFALILIGLVVLGGALIADPVSEYLRMKRPDYPIQN